MGKLIDGSGFFGKKSMSERKGLGRADTSKPPIISRKPPKSVEKTHSYMESMARRIDMERIAAEIESYIRERPNTSPKINWKIVESVKQGWLRRYPTNELLLQAAERERGRKDEWSIQPNFFLGLREALRERAQQTEGPDMDPAS